MELEQQVVTEIAENAVIENNKHTGLKVGISLGTVALAATGFFLVRRIIRKHKANKAAEQVAE